jgi:hypothetical protein
VILAACLAGCARQDDDKSTAAQTGPRPPAPPAEPSLLDLPAHVPRRATGPASPVAVRVVGAWTRSLRHGDVVAAATYFASGSLVQNASPVLVLRTAAQRREFNRSLPCGARPIRAGGAGRFTVVTFRLTERVGGDCRGAAGHLARCSIRVAKGRIVEWYRLPDPAGRRPPAPAAPADSVRA